MPDTELPEKVIELQEIDGGRQSASQHQRSNVVTFPRKGVVRLNLSDVTPPSE